MGQSLKREHGSFSQNWKGPEKEQSQGQIWDYNWILIVLDTSVVLLLLPSYHSLSKRDNFSGLEDLFKQLATRLSIAHNNNTFIQKTDHTLLLGIVFTIIFFNH